MKRFVFCVLLLFVIGCSPEPRPAPIFSIGDLVIHKISGVEGQVLTIHWYDSSCKSWVYTVRFSMNSLKIPEHILGSGGTLGFVPFHTEKYVREFELEVKE